MNRYGGTLHVEALCSLVHTNSDLDPAHVRLGFYTMPMDHVMSASDIQLIDEQQFILKQNQ